MSHWTNLLFLLVFLSQIFVSSYYLPKLILARLDRLRVEYPPERYPKLYPRSVGAHSACRSLFQWSSRVVVAVGLVLLYFALVVDRGSFSDEGYISDAWPAVYGVIQFLPLLLIELLGFRQFRRMREANMDPTRKAALRPRRLRDYLSPGLVVLAVALLIAAVGFALYAHDFSQARGGNAVLQAMVVVAANMALTAVGLWQLHGRKLDPYQAARDRARQTRAQLTSLLLLSCVLSVFFIWQVAGNVFSLHSLDAPVMSLYFQLIVALSIGLVLRSLRFEDIDFEVYADDASMEKNHG